MSAQLVKYFKWLDALRDSGTTNMFGAAPYLAGAFDLEKSAARKIVQQWATTFDRDKSAEERAGVS